MNWYVEQDVYCLKHGVGKITSINKSGFYGITAVFKGSVTDTYNIEGYRLSNDATPMLYPSKPKIILPKWQPKPGEWCWFWDENDVGVFIIQQFSRIVGEGYCGTTGTRWDNCAQFVGELPEHLKEVKQ